MKQNLGKINFTPSVISIAHELVIPSHLRSYDYNIGASLRPVANNQSYHSPRPSEAP